VSPTPATRLSLQPWRAYGMSVTGVLCRRGEFVVLPDVGVD
jgi:hypothetical protein